VDLGSCFVSVEVVCYEDHDYTENVKKEDASQADD
jgi:hypothetical protein